MCEVKTGKRAVKTGQNLGLGCLFLQATGRPAGLCGPRISRGRGQEYTSMGHASSPYYVLGPVQGGHWVSSMIQTGLLSWNVYSGREGCSTSRLANTNYVGCSKDAE